MITCIQQSLYQNYGSFSHGLFISSLNRYKPTVNSLNFDIDFFFFTNLSFSKKKNHLIKKMPFVISILYACSNTYRAWYPSLLFLYKRWIQWLKSSWWSSWQKPFNTIHTVPRRGWFAPKQGLLQWFHFRNLSLLMSP